MPVLIYCKAENVYALLYRESIVRKILRAHEEPDVEAPPLPLLLREFFFLLFGLIALNLRGEVIVFDVLFWQGSNG